MDSKICNLEARIQIGGGGALEQVGEMMLGFENQGGVRGIRKNVLDCILYRIIIGRMERDLPHSGGASSVQKF